MRTWQDQIIGAFESGINKGFEETERQKALARQEQKRKEQEERTMRQQAFQTAVQLGVTPEMVYNEMSGQGEQIRQAEAAPGFEGPPRQGLFDVLTERRQQERALADEQRRQAQLDRDLGRRVKEAQIASYGQKQKMAEQKAMQPKEFKQNQYAAGGFAKRAETAASQLSPELVQSAIGDVFESSQYFPEIMKSPERKQLEQVQRNFISAVLRKESGAAISPAEFAEEGKKYFPQVGDDPQTLALKEQARNQAIANLRAEAGGAYEQIASAPAVQVAPTQQRQSFSFMPGATPLMDNTANAASPEDMQRAVKAMSREEKIRLIQGQ